MSGMNCLNASAVVAKQHWGKTNNLQFGLVAHGGVVGECGGCGDGDADGGEGKTSITWAFLLCDNLFGSVVVVAFVDEIILALTGVGV